MYPAINARPSEHHELATDRRSWSTIAPWVEPAHSKNATMQAARLIPASAFGVWNLLPKFSMLQARPAFAYSGALFTNLSNAVFGSGSQEEGQTENCRRMDVDYGVPRAVQSQLAELAMKSTFAEETVGANSEALLCLKKGLPTAWGACQDYDAYVKRLYATEQERLGNSANSGQTSAKLRIRAYFAESDALIGKKGDAYLTQCFKGEARGPSSSAVDFETSTIAGTDHDSILGMVDVLEEIFVQAGGHLPPPTG